MSELKAYIAPTPDGTGLAEYYLKSEADKVIAELEEKLKNSRNARKYWRKEYLIEYKECLHNKYKRCLAMARLCRSCWSANIFIHEGPDRISMHFMKWEKRWLELADKFKEAK